MRRQGHVIEAVRQTNRETANSSCAMFDSVGRALSPSHLQGAQDGLRRQLLWVEDAIRSLRWRNGRRAMRWQRVLAQDPKNRGLQKKHQALLSTRLIVLQTQRRILRQIGDGLAWLILGEDPRLLALLYGERTHMLPQGLGLGGPMMLARKAHDSGKYYVLENDLTRCLGMGDLTVVPADRGWIRPLSLEIKSKGQWKEGAEVKIGAIAIEYDHPVDAELYRDVRGTVGLKDSRSTNLSARMRVR